MFATFPAIGAEMSVLIKLADDVNLWMDGWMDGRKEGRKEASREKVTIVGVSVCCSCCVWVLVFWGF